MIDLTRSCTDVGFAFRLATFLRELESDDPMRNLRLHCADDFELSVALMRMPITGTNPELVIAKFPSGTLIMIAGANNIDLGILTLSGYSQQYDGANPANANPVFWDQATSIRLQAIAFGADLTAPVRIIGHSMGGAIAAHLQFQLERSGAGDVQTIILNSPRLGTADYCTQVEGLRLTRYFCADDPVQFVPFHSDEATLAHVALSPSVSQAYNRQSHPRNGISVASDGTLTDAAMVTTPLPNTSLSLLQWLVFSTTGPGVNHKLIEITQRMRLAADRLEPVGTIRSRADANDRPVTLRPRVAPTVPVEVPIPADEARRNIVASRPAAVAQAGADESTMIPRRNIGLFKGKKVEGVWSVVYMYASGPEVVEITVGKRDAKTRARRYNRQARNGQEFFGMPAAVKEIITSAFEVA